MDEFKEGEENVYSEEGDYHCPFCLGEGFYWDEQELEFYTWEPGYDTSLALRQEEGIKPGNVRVPLRIFYTEYDETLTADDRVIDDAYYGTGSIIDSQTEVGGWSTLATATAPTDSDQDGMPDSWENSYSWLNPYDASDACKFYDGSGFTGYTNIETYIHSLSD